MTPFQALRMLFGLCSNLMILDPHWIFPKNDVSELSKMSCWLHRKSPKVKLCTEKLLPKRISCTKGDTRTKNGDWKQASLKRAKEAPFFSTYFFPVAPFSCKWKCPSRYSKFSVHYKCRYFWWFLGLEEDKST